VDAHLELFRGPHQRIGEFSEDVTVTDLRRGLRQRRAGRRHHYLRPPYAPVALGALAGRAFEPVRYCPVQSWHEAHGAVPLVAGA
jgi:hypothetical protein